MFDVVLLFEKTGLAAACFEAHGFKTLCIDNAGPEQAPNRTTLSWDILEKEAEIIALAKGCRLVIGFPPCTDLAVSGAKHFLKKVIADPQFQQKALKLFRSVERIGTALGVSWCAENPKSVVSTLWRPPSFRFDPWEYGGWLPEDDEHPLWPKYIAPRDAYPKETFLWSGNQFKMPQKKPVTPEPGWSRQVRLLGGKSDRTKTIRSASPRGIFTALAYELREQK